MSAASQLTFDLWGDRDQALAPWTGSPLRYHVAYLDPAEHLAAFDRWVDEHPDGDRGAYVRSHMWHSGWSNPFEFDGHTFTHLLADARRNGDEWDASLGSLVPDELMHQVICTACRWHHITSSENGAVEAWHDHAIPGWRHQPVMPRNLVPMDWSKPGKKTLAWIAKHIPVEWQRPGSPIRTERSGIGTRHVPGRSPFGGFDLGHKIDAEESP